MFVVGVIKADTVEFGWVGIGVATCVKSYWVGFIIGGGVAKLGSDLPALLTALTRNMYSLFSWSPSTVPVLLSPFTSVPYN